MISLLKSPIFRWTILGVFLLEILSFFAWLLPSFGNVAFFVILAIVLLLSLKDLRYGLGAVVAELIIGSHGYLFSLQLDNLAISLRIGLFLVVMAVAVIDVFKKKRLEIYYSKMFWPFVALAAVLLYAFLRGGLGGNGFAMAFLDGNGYMFFALVLPFWQALKEKADFYLIFEVGIAALLTSIAKVFFILYTFSHKFWWMMPETYKWIRDTRIGEITEITDVFFRIFFASQIYAAIAFVIMFVFLLSWHQKTPLKKVWRDKSWWLALVFTLLLLASTLISLSRSNWVGLVVAAVVLVVAFFLIYKKPFQQIGFSIAYTIILTILSGVLITSAVLFPFPLPAGGFSARSLFSDRALSLGSGEAAIDSRFGLLQPMLEAIKKQPFGGYGFGKTLTYITKDPRILADNPSGEYTTHAFEWGYLELWIKLGLVGLLIYAYIFYLVVSGSLKELWAKRKSDFDQDTLLILGFLLGGIVLLATHAFSPYLNHPLGIGYVILWAVLLERFSSQEAIVKKR